MPTKCFQMEDKLNIFSNGTRPNLFWKMEDYPIYLKMENYLNLKKMEDDLNIMANGRPSQYSGKWKTTSI